MTDRWAVTGVGALPPDRARAIETGGASADLSVLPRALRKALSGPIRCAAHVAGQAIASLPVPRDELAIVYGSAFGEMRTAVDLIGAGLRGEPASPASFRHSVHNAAAGLLSIALGSMQPVVAVAAGEDTVFAALTDATAALQVEEVTTVLVVFADESIPGELRALVPHEPLAAAWVMTSRPAERPLATIGAPQRATTPSPAVRGAAPLSPALAVVDAIERGQPGRVWLNRDWYVDVRPSGGPS